MDKRTREGKMFEQLPTSEKSIYLLEKILQSTRKTELNTELTNKSSVRQEKILKFMAKRIIEIQELENVDRYWTKSYIKSLKKELEYF